jgi:hypothetical protein
MVVGCCYRASTAIFSVSSISNPLPYLIGTSIDQLLNGLRGYVGFTGFVLNFSMEDPKNVSVGSRRHDDNFSVASMSNPLPYLIGTTIDQILNGLRGYVGFTGLF